MELRQMRYFVAVAEELRFRRAAERLHISTPSLSQQIKAVEREIGGPLLIRGPQGVTLTAAGEALLRSARAVLAAADEAVREAREVAGSAREVLRFGLLIGPDRRRRPRRRHPTDRRRTRHRPRRCVPGRPVPIPSGRHREPRP